MGTAAASLVPVNPALKMLAARKKDEAVSVPTNENLAAKEEARAEVVIAEAENEAAATAAVTAGAIAAVAETVDVARETTAAKSRCRMQAAQQFQP